MKIKLALFIDTAVISIRWRCCVAVIIGRTTGLARPSVRLSVRLSVPHGFLTGKQRGTGILGLA